MDKRITKQKENSSRPRPKPDLSEEELKRLIALSHSQSMVIKLLLKR